MVIDYEGRLLLRCYSDVGVVWCVWCGVVRRI